MQSLIEKLGLGERASSLILWIGLSVLLLIVVVAVAAWLVRILRPGINMSGGGSRSGRPQRLAVTDAFTLDREGRKLVIVRRDNVEHLLLIGGPTDVLVEANIVRGERGRRNPADEFGAAADSFANAEVPQPPVPASMVPAPTLPTAPAAPVIPPFQRAAPAAPATPISRPMPPAATAAQLDDDFERSLMAGTKPQAAPPPAAPPRQQPAPPPPPPPAPPPVTMRPLPPPPPVPPVAPPPPPPPPPVAQPAPPPAAVRPAPAPAEPAERPARQEPVSEMARRLNEVLQKPLSGQLRQPFNKAIPPVPSTPSVMPPPPPPAPAATPAGEARKAPPVDELDLLASMIDPPKQAAPVPPPAPAAPAAPPAAAPAAAKPVEADMDMLEEEMARLLGRPNQPKAP